MAFFLLSAAAYFLSAIRLGGDVGIEPHQGDSIVRRVSGSRWEISYFGLKQLLASNGQLDEAQVVPVYNGLGWRGLRLTFRDGTSFLARIGFQSGDIITTVNGVRLDNESTLRRMEAQTASSDSVILGIDRADEHLTHRYDLR